jgi:hypothetical protein
MVGWNDVMVIRAFTQEFESDMFQRIAGAIAVG